MSIDRAPDLLPNCCKDVLYRSIGALGIYRTFMDVGGFTGRLFFMIVFEGYGSYYTFLTAIMLLAASMAPIATVKTKKA